MKRHPIGSIGNYLTVLGGGEKSKKRKMSKGGSKVNMAQGPAFPKDPIDLLTRKDHIKEPFINSFIYPLLFGGGAFAISLLANHHTKRPVLSGIPRHILITVAGYFIGEFARKRRESYTAERDAILLHYVKLHPEDFPPFERKKFSEVLQPWTPIR